MRRCIELVSAHPVFQRRRFFHGQGIRGGEGSDIAWLDTSGKEMSEEDWMRDKLRSFGVQLFGKSIDIDEHGDAIDGETFVILFNGDHAAPVDFHLPAIGDDQRYSVAIDTASPTDGTAQPIEGPNYLLSPCSAVLLQLVEPSGTP